MTYCTSFLTVLAVIGMQLEERKSPHGFRMAECRMAGQYTSWPVESTLSQVSRTCPVGATIGFRESLGVTSIHANYSLEMERSLFGFRSP